MIYYRGTVQKLVKMVQRYNSDIRKDDTEIWISDK